MPFIKAVLTSFVLFPRYILGIESPLVCDILPLADDHHGLMDVTPEQFEHHDVTHLHDGVTHEQVDAAKKQEKTRLANDCSKRNFYNLNIRLNLVK